MTNQFIAGPSAPRPQIFRQCSDSALKRLFVFVECDMMQLGKSDNSTSSRGQLRVALAPLQSRRRGQVRNIKEPPYICRTEGSHDSNIQTGRRTQASHSLGFDSRWAIRRKGSALRERECRRPVQVWSGESDLFSCAASPWTNISRRCASVKRHQTTVLKVSAAVNPATTVLNCSFGDLPHHFMVTRRLFQNIKGERIFVVKNSKRAP